MTQTFPNWTAYDSWLIENYANYSIYKLTESDGKIIAEFEEKKETK